MKDCWYGDRQDLVKWSVLVHLARECRITRILQVALDQPCHTSLGHLQGCGPGAPTKSVPLLPEVIEHFRRDIDDIHGLEGSVHLEVEVLREVAGAERTAHYDAVLRRLADSSREPLIVFLDPDTGILPNSSRPSPKHVAGDELRCVYKAMGPRDLLVCYQHARRRDGWKHQIRREFASALAIPEDDVGMIWCREGAKKPDVVFVVLESQMG